MTTYTPIGAGVIDVDSPITQSLMTLLRDNPIAITEGASGAPKIQRGAIQPGVGHKWFYDYGTGALGTVTTAGGGAGSSTVNPGLRQYVNYTLSAGDTLDLNFPGPLVITATGSITINGTIDVDSMGGRGGASGASNQGENGLIGGSGGGAGGGGKGGSTLFTAGGAPGSNGSSMAGTALAMALAWPLIATNREGGMSGNVDGLRTPRNEFDSVCGGAGGGGYSGGNGGYGGGVVILVAPQVTIGTAGIITADGQAVAATNAGGGGGGAIIIATPNGGYQNNNSFGTVGVAAFGGAASGTGGNGADGIAPTSIVVPTITL